MLQILATLMINALAFSPGFLVYDWLMCICDFYLLSVNVYFYNSYVDRTGYNSCYSKWVPFLAKRTGNTFTI